MTDAQLFLSRVEIKDFRGYGDFSLSLPAQPCVVLLSGPNGLGKTSFFEAVEWALTSKVRRLEEISSNGLHSRDLARRGHGVIGAHVSLSFHDHARGDQEEWISRTQPVGQPGISLAPYGRELSSVADLLRWDTQRWHVSADNLSDYLHLTHFHTQSSSLRLIGFGPRERWMQVSPLAGADRFDRVRSNLTNVKGALTRVREQRRRALEDASKEKHTWHRMLTDRARLGAVNAALASAIPPAEALAEAEAMRLELDLEENAVSATSDLVVHAGYTLSELRERVKELVTANRERFVAVEELRPTLNTWTEINIKQQQQAAEVRDADSRYARVSVQLANLGTQLLAAREATARRKGQANDAVRGHEHAFRTKVALAGIRELRVRSAEADMELASTRHRLDEASTLLRHETVTLHSQLERERELASARDQLGKMDGARAAYAESVSLETHRHRREAHRATLTTQLATQQRRSAELEAEIATTVEAQALVQQRLQAARAEEEAFQTALAVVARNIGPSDTECPVCKTHFDAGILHGIARASIANTRLTEYEDELSSLERELAKLSAEQNEVRGLVRRLEADRRSTERDISELDSRISELRSKAGASAEQLDRDASMLAAKVRELEGRLRIGQPRTELDAVVRKRREEVSALERVVSDLEERQQGRDRVIREFEAIVDLTFTGRDPYDVSDEELDTLLESRTESAQSARHAEEEAERLQRELEAEHAAVKLQRDTLERSRLYLKAEIEELQQLATETSKRWEQTGLPGPPAASTLSEAQTLHATTERKLAKALRKLVELSAGLEVWTARESERNLEDEISALLGDRSETDYDRELQNNIDLAEYKLAQAVRARDGADELSAELETITHEFGERALEPFGVLFSNYLTAMVSDSRFHGISAKYAPAARAAGLRFLVVLGDHTSDAEYILSEGQMGEVSLAAMLAAGSTFPWSRWRALLLDDPTQYNDLIHATALYDVLRNLAAFAGYQVIVSTHDPEQASFLRRKLEGMGVPWVDCRYLGQGDSGIITKLTYSSGFERLGESQTGPTQGPP